MRCVVDAGAPLHAVEDEEIRAQDKQSSVSNTGRLQVGFSALGDGRGSQFVTCMLIGSTMLQVMTVASSVNGPDQGMQSRHLASGSCRIR